MPTYRAYAVDENGAMGPPKVFDCDDDQQAIWKAKASVDGHDVELWNGDRVVAKFSAAVKSFGSEVPPLSINCSWCGALMRLISSEPSPVAHSYECPNGHKSEFLE